MKKIFLCMAVALLALTACQPDENGLNNDLTFNFTIGEKAGFNTPGTKAVKTGWVNGDCVFVVFFNSDKDAQYRIDEVGGKYLKLTYNNGSWDASMEGGLTSDDIRKADIDGKGNLHALYMEGVEKLYTWSYGTTLGYGKNEFSSCGKTTYFGYDCFFPKEAFPLTLTTAANSAIDYSISESGEVTATIELGLASFCKTQLAITGLPEGNWYVTNSVWIKNVFFRGYEFNIDNLNGFTKGIRTVAGSGENNQYDFYGNIGLYSQSIIYLVNFDDKVVYVKDFGYDAIMNNGTAYRTKGPAIFGMTGSTDENGWTPNVIDID